jgi:hypothetical protein
LLCIVPFCTIPKAEALHFVADAGAFRSTQTPESDRKYKVTINPSRLNQQIVSTDFGIVFQHPEDQVTFRCFAMDSSMKASNGKDFYIVLDQLPDYVFKDGDIVSGKCCLLSSVDEDVGCVAISFHGTVKVRFVLTSNTNQAHAGYSQNHQPNNYDSEDVLFSDVKMLYQGPYTLRKNVLYEWPFQFQFPSGTSLPPSGTFRKDHWNSATVTYELEACRGRTSQEAAMLEKRITPVSKNRDASTQSRTLFERIGSFTGSM